MVFGIVGGALFAVFGLAAILAGGPLWRDDWGRQMSMFGRMSDGWRVWARFRYISLGVVLVGGGAVLLTFAIASTL
jgi:hypothetical protein